MNEPNENMLSQAARISKMEQIFDEITKVQELLNNAVMEYEKILPEWKELEEYYVNGQWQRDYDDDALGKIPAELKRGVLSQDGVYDLLIDRTELMDRLKQIAEEMN